MISEFYFHFVYDTEVDANKSTITREKISQLIASGILFPDEVRYAKQLLRCMNTEF